MKKITKKKIENIQEIGKNREKIGQKSEKIAKNKRYVNYWPPCKFKQLFFNDSFGVVYIQKATIEKRLS